MFLAKRNDLAFIDSDVQFGNTLHKNPSSETGFSSLSLRQGANFGT
jgi:hypothetical protein